MEVAICQTLKQTVHILSPTDEILFDLDSVCTYLPFRLAFMYRCYEEQSLHHCVCHFYWPPFVRHSASNQPEAKFMHTSRQLGPDRPWGPPSLLYDGYWASLSEVKRPGRGVDHPPSSSAEVKEKVE